MSVRIWNKGLGDIPPDGSFSLGNISPPHIDHAATAVTIPVNASEKSASQR